MRIAMWLALPALLLVADSAAAQGTTVIYRCTDTKGVVTLQNGTACPKGSQQVKRSVSNTPAAPFPTPLPAPDAVTTVPTPVGPTQSAPGVAANAADDAPSVLPLPAAQKPPAQRLPPPPLYQCFVAGNQDSYLSDSAEPQPRCLRVDTIGIDGSQALGAGEACSMVYDQCQRIPDAAACDAWRKHVNEAQSAWTFARADSRELAKAEYERIARIVAETTCNP